MNGRLRRPRFTRTPSGMVGLIMLVFVVLVALFGPMISTQDPNVPVGLPGAGPSSGHPFGLDFLGRDVFSRVLHGGRSVLLLGTLATVLSYGIAVMLGLYAGYTRGILDPLIMRGVDVLLAFPSLLLILLLVTGLGTSTTALITGVVLVLVPGLVRLVRTATLEVGTRGYVRAAVARGEPMLGVLRREILPNITPTIMASAGLGFAYSVLIIASLNYLGLGLQPPTSDWGLLVSENTAVINLNPWSVLVPGILLGFLMISVNLITDAYWQTASSSASSLVRPGRKRGGDAGTEKESLERLLSTTEHPL